jgi:hypothetical protein
MPVVLEAMSKWESLAKQLNVKVHFFLNGAPERVFYALVDAPNPASVGRFMFGALLVPSSYKVTAVQTVEETVAVVKALTAQASH